MHLLAVGAIQKAVGKGIKSVSFLERRSRDANGARRRVSIAPPGVFPAASLFTICYRSQRAYQTPVD
jgi:hypothetical protein